jgi:hypothetical protein
MSDLTSESNEDIDDMEVKRQRLSDILHSMTSYFKKNTIFPAVKVTLLVYDSDPDLQLSLDLSIYPSESVQTVKERISTFHNIPVTEQILIYKEKILTGNSSDWEIEENDSLHLFMPTISVTIKPLGSRDTLAIRANPSMSVYLLKQLIEASKGFPSDCQRLVLHGRILKDKELVSDINFSTDCLLVLIMVKQ